MMHCVSLLARDNAVQDSLLYAIVIVTQQNVTWRKARRAIVEARR